MQVPPHKVFVSLLLSALVAASVFTSGVCFSDWGVGAGSDTSGGKLKLVITPTKNKDLKPAYDLIRKSKAFETMINDLNATIKLPQDLEVVFDECGVINAFYLIKAAKIVMCYEIVLESRRLFLELKETKGDANTYATEAVLFIFLHELGHALVNQLEIPITGKEEDAVDEMATILMLQRPGGGDAVLSALTHFGMIADAELAATMGDLAFWDEHSLSVQRFYSIACLLYGSDPDTYGALLVEDGGKSMLPADRAGFCLTEYAQKKRNWSVLLKDHMR